MIGLEKKLEEALLKKKIVSKETLEKAKKESKETRKPLREILVEENILTEEEIVVILAEITGIPYLDISDYVIDKDIIKLVSEQLARKSFLMPLFRVENNLTVAMADPTDILAIDRIKTKCKCDIEPVFATKDSIKTAINQYYGTSGTLEEVIGKIDARSMGLKEGEEIDIRRLKDVVKETPVVKIVNFLISQAVQEKASDIHIEPEQDRLMVRYRVDGILHDAPNPPKYLQPAVISRIKILANMDIAETRAPQDGRFNVKVEGKDIDIRVSVFPTVNGENVVLRLLDKTTALFSLSQLGFSTETLKRYEALIRSPYGIILVTGPTGSGKTTTLYSSLNIINSPEKNIITIEDPVEYQLPLIRQSQVNPKANLTFASGLRSILRQDPDIIMVGEIRDVETAEISVQAALTGHLVFSTLHTNDATGALSRLTDMGVEAFLISSSVAGILAQRLVRKICENCKEPHKPPPEILKKLEFKGNAPSTFYKGKGCKKCKSTGYKGRIGIFELLLMNDKIRDLVVKQASSSEIKQEAVKEGMVTMMEDGLEKVRNGVTTLEEVLQVTQI